MRLRFRMRTGGAGGASKAPFSVRIVESCVNATNETNITLRITGVEIGDSVDWSVGTVNGSVTISSVPELITGVDLSSLSDGTLTVSGINNTTGDTSTSTKTKDTVSPSGYAVALSNPLGFTEISTQAKLDFTGLEVGALVNWRIDRFIFETIAGSFVASAAIESITVDVSSLSDGNLQAKCTLTDACGNVGSQASSAVVVKDSVAPIGYSIDAITDPINNQNETNIQIDFVNLEIGATAFWSITDGVNTINDDFIVAATSESIFEDVSTLNNGTLTVSLVLVDTAGNQGVIETGTTNKQVFTPSGYSVAFDEASYDGTTGLNATIDISGANVGNIYSLTITSSGGGTPIVYTGTVGSATFSISNIDLTTLNTGTGTATYLETDSFGNVGGDATDTADFVFAVPIYGLRFNGINANLNLDATYDWSGDSIVVDMVMRNVSLTYNGIGNLSSNANNTRILFGEVSGNRRVFIGATAQNGILIGENNDRTTLTITDLGGSDFRIESSVNTSSYDVVANSVVRQINVFGSENNRFYLHADVISFTIGGVVFDDSNNWRGATINGAVRIISTDGGATWNPV
jgi:hypothetical protein